MIGAQNVNLLRKLICTVNANPARNHEQDASCRLETTGQGETFMDTRGHEEHNLEVHGPEIERLSDHGGG
jgi:hypothetical protein